MAMNAHDLGAELERQIHQVSTQYRRLEGMRCLIRFGVATLGLTLAATVALAFRADLGLTRAAIYGLFALGEAVAAVALVVRPMLRAPSLERIALFIDERYPELENRIVSAVEFSSGKYDNVSSSWMIEEFLRQSRGVSRRVRFGDLIDGGLLLRLAMAAGFFWLVWAAAMVGFRGYWAPPKAAVAGLDPNDPFLSFENPDVEFTVDPGDARVRVGDNQSIWVRSREGGRTVKLRWGSDPDALNEVEMRQGATRNAHSHYLTDIREDLIYQVQFGNQLSREFKITTWLPPHVGQIDLTYKYPEYIGREDREVPNGGTIVALEGTEVDLEVMVNKKVETAELVLRSGERIALTPADEATWTGRITVAHNDRYHVELVDAEGERNEYPAEYDITAEEDSAPSIEINFPRGDHEVTMIEEIPLDFEVSDDYGLTDYGYQFEVVGKEPVRISLNPDGQTRATARGFHQLLLEELGLESRDLVTWTIWAEDRKPGRAEYELLGEPYFLEIVPFSMTYEEAISNQQAREQQEQQQGEQQGQQGGDDATSEKDIIIAIWNLRRNSPNLEPAEFTSQRETIFESQLQLLQRYESGEALEEGAVLDEKTLADLMLAMTQVVEALQRAEQPEPAPDLTEATSAAQRAYRLILKLKPDRAQVQQRRENERQRQQRQQQQRGQSASQQEAERRMREQVEGLELDETQNFYEQERTTQQQQSQQQREEQQQAAEEALTNIRDLARRQQAANEEMNELISELERAQTEEDRRRLERRLENLRQEMEQNLERLDRANSEAARSPMEPTQQRETRQALQQAREQMNRSLENLRQNQLQQARSAGQRAQSALRDIEQQLEQLSRDDAAQRMESLLDAMDGLIDRQQAIQDRIAEMNRRAQDPNAIAANRNDREERRQANQQKSELRREFVDMMNDASDLAARSAQNQELMSRKLNDWLRETASRGIPEEIVEGEALINFGILDSAEQHEAGVRDMLEKADASLQLVAEQAIADDVEGLLKALSTLEQIYDQQQQDQQIAQGEQQGQQEGQQQGQQPGQQQGQQPGQQQGQQPGQQQGQQPGQQQGQQPGQQQGQQPGQQQGQQPGQQAGQQPGQQAGQQPGQQQGQRAGQQGQRQGQRGQRGGQQQGSRQQGGQFDPNQQFQQGGQFDPTQQQFQQGGRQGQRGADPQQRSFDPSNIDPRTGQPRQATAEQREAQAFAEAAGRLPRSDRQPLDPAAEEALRALRAGEPLTDEQREALAQAQAAGRLPRDPNQQGDPNRQGQGQGDPNQQQQGGQQGDPNQQQGQRGGQRGQQGDPTQQQQGQGGQGDPQQDPTRQGQGGRGERIPTQQQDPTRPGEVRPGDPTQQQQDPPRPGETPQPGERRPTEFRPGEAPPGERQPTEFQPGQFDPRPFDPNRPPNFNPQGGARGGGRDDYGARNRNSAWGGGWNDYRRNNPIGPEDLVDFIERDYRDWVDYLRNAEALLPQDSDYRRELERVRMEIEDMRLAYRRHTLMPQYDLFLEKIADPLAETMDRIERQILDILHQREFVLTDEGSVPANYQNRVAEYFRALSEKNDKDPPRR